MSDSFHLTLEGFFFVSWIFFGSCGVVYSYYKKSKDNSKKLIVESAKFVLAKPRFRWGDDPNYLEVVPRDSFEVEPKVIRNSTTNRVDRVEKGGWCFKVIRPNLEHNYRKNTYELKLIEETYNLDEVVIPKDDYPNFKNWQEIGDMLRETWKIGSKISRYRSIIGEIRTKIPFAAASNIYSGYVQIYEQSILNLENEIKAGEEFSEELKKLIREYLLGMELSGIDPIKVINEVDRSRQRNKELGLDLEDRYNSLLSDAEIYLSTIDDYSEIMESLRNL